MVHYEILDVQNFFKIRMESVYLKDDDLYDRFKELIDSEEGFKLTDGGEIGGNWVIIEYNGHYDSGEVTAIIDAILYELGQDYESDIIKEVEEGQGELVLTPEDLEKPESPEPTREAEDV
jgi:hypothetical protein